MEQLKNLLWYMGLTQAEFRRITDDIYESNRQSILIFSLLTAAGMGVLFIATFIMRSLESSRLVYFFSCLLSLGMLYVALKPAKKHKWLSTIGIYLFLALVFAFGIAMGTMITPDEMTVSFIVFLFAGPILFLDSPFRMNMVVLITMAVYFFIARATQTPDMLQSNMVNVVLYGAMSIILSTYMMNIKALRYSYEQKTRYLSESDQLTGLLNRRSFDEHISRLRGANGTSVTVCAFDLNGLKAANDSLGHRAGDELIRGAADCIESVFGPYGKCYRTGGDEYMAILEGLSPTADELSEMLAARTSAWRGNLVSGMSISLGIVKSDGAMSVDEMVHEADQRMYANKAEYYRRNGIDRRKR